VVTSKAVNPPKSLYHVNHRGHPIHTEAAHMSTDRALERPFFSMRTKVTQIMLVSLESRFALLARQLFGHDE
jgi:hypothetical protein